MSQKPGTKQEQKRGGKQRAIKKPNQKGEKDNKTLSQKTEKGREFFWQKGNKREGTEDQGEVIDDMEDIISIFRKTQGKWNNLVKSNSLSKWSS
jgi:hypothetical protein